MGPSEAAHWLDALAIASPHWPCWDEATSRTLDDVAHDVRRFKGQEVLALWIPLLNEAMDATDYDAVAEALLRRTGRWPPADEEEDE